MSTSPILDTSPVVAAPPPPVVLGSLEAFLRAFPRRGPRLAWLLGAGCSAMSGIPTAGQLIEQFRVELYCSENRINRQRVNVADRNQRSQIDAYFAANRQFPSIDDLDSYAEYFELAYPTPEDRRALIDSVTRGVSPNYGHYVIAALTAVDAIRVVITTNFDELPESAMRQLFSDLKRQMAVTAADLDNGLVLTSLQKESWPLVGKIHGDFRSDRLKNTSGELEKQDPMCRDFMIETASRFGLCVAGYSGRDESVMEALSSALERPKPFPEGIVWFHRTGTSIAEPVRQFLEAATAKGVHAEAIPVENFVELFDRIAEMTTFPDDIRTWLNTHRDVGPPTPAPVPAGDAQWWPVLRLNAFPITQMPPTARVLSTNKFHRLKDLQVALRKARARGLVAQSNGQLIALGHDKQIEAALAPLGVVPTSDTVPMFISDTNTGTTATGLPQWLNTGELGLAIDALTLGLGRQDGLRHFLSGKGHFVYVDNEKEPSLGPLRTASAGRNERTGRLTGKVRGTSISWAESVSINLEWHDDQWWLLLTPRVWTSRPVVPKELVGNEEAIKAFNVQQKVLAADFTRERTATRYNEQAGNLLAAWVNVLGLGADERTVHAWNLAEGEGVDGSVTFSTRTAFCRPLISSENKS